ncbi:Domain of unknown function DUF4214 [uncultured Caudovirales phage]|uniref:DUF4214 domain-containing protein n=1 Tax=uncultured Caudovirales phage TaxID=2100421 RepID=A0A6J5KP23_9CAUD|nr:Domain of unknown function DUF4214 [uncultured Caudovirales phage]
MSIPVGTLTIEMAANVARLQKDMDAAKKTVSDAMTSIKSGASSAMNALAGLGVTLSVAAFASYIKGAIDAADKLNDLSKVTAISVENLSGLDLAAKQSGGDLEGIAQSINKLSVHIGEDAEKFKLLGITAKEPLEAFKQLADMFVKIEDPQLRAAVAAAALGKSWASAAPLLAEGGEKIQEMVDKGKALSGITPELVEKADKFNDKLAEIGVSAKRTSMVMSAELLPILQTLADEFAESQRTGGALSVIVEGIAIAFEAVVVVVANTVYVLKQVYLEIEGIAKQVGALATLDFSAFKEIGTQMKADAAAARKDIDAFTDRILNARRNAAEIDALARRNPPKVGDEEAARAAAAAAAAKKAAEEFLKYKAEQAGAYQKMIVAADKLVESIKFETDALTMSNVEKETAIALQKLLSLGIKEGTEEWNKYSEAVIAATIEKEQMKSLVELRKKLDEESVKANEDLQKERLKQDEKYAEEIKQINNQIGQSLSDALMSGSLNAGEFIKNMFKTMILRPVIQPILTGVVGAVTGAFSVGALAGGAPDGSAGDSTYNSLGLVSAASSLKSGYELLSGGFTSLGSTVTSYASELGMTLTATNQAGTALASVGESLLSSASALGSIASYGAGIGAGLMAGNLISDGKGIGGGSSWLTVGGGAAIGAIVGGPLGAALGGVVGGLANAAFGTGKKKIDDTGLKITFNSMKTTVDAYEDWSKAGGFLSGGKKGQELKQVDSELQKYFDVSVGAVAVSIRQYTDILKLPARDLTQYSQEVQRSLEGLSPEDAQKAINETIKAYANGLATFAAGEIAAYQRSGEQFSDTLARLGGSLKTVNDTLGILNISLYETSVAGADAASKLVDSFGGLEKFVAATDVYYQNFYSAKERADKTGQNLGDVFKQLGLTMPATNAQFRQMVETARAAGDDTLFANLIKLAPAFSNYQKSLVELLGATTKVSGGIASVASDISSVADSLYAAVDAAFQNIQSSIQAEQQAAINAIERQLAIAEAQKSVAQENVDSLTSIFDYLTSQINDLTGAVASAQSAAEGAAFIRSAIEAANNTGYLPDQKALEAAVESVRAGMAATTYASSYEQKLAQMKLAAQLSDLNGVAQEQKTTAELQLEVATKTIDDLNAQVAVTNAFYESQLIYAQAQVNELRNVNGSVLTVAGAMAALGAAIDAARSQGGGDGGGGGSGGTGGGGDSSRTDQINSMYQQILGRNAESAGLDSWNNSGLSIDQIREGIANSAEAKAKGYAVGGYYPGGLAMVGERGPELINFNRPGQIYTAGQTSEIMGGSSLAAEIQALRADIRAQSRSNAQIQIRTAKVLERWEYSGLPDTRVEV